MSTPHDNRTRRPPRLSRALIGIMGALVLLLLAIAALGCFFDPISRDLVGPYRLLAVDDKENLGLIYRFDPERESGALRIEPVVVDVGWNDRYMVAARRAPHKPGSDLSYYYIDMTRDHGGGVSEGVVFGPFTEEEFAGVKAEMALPEFSVHYPELR